MHPAPCKKDLPDIFGLQIGSLQGRAFPDRWSRGTKTLGMRLLAFQWKPPTSLSARTICDITGDFDLIWYSVRVLPVRNFSNFDHQVWFVILDKQLYWGLIHTMPEKFENAALFLRLGLPSTIICHENGSSSNENAVQTRGIWKRRLCVLMWLENIFKMELFQNDNVTISSNTNPTWLVIVAFSNFFNEMWTENIWCVFRVTNTLFNFLRRCVDGAWVFAVPG